MIQIPGPNRQELEMGCRNRCPSIFQADGGLRRPRRRPGDGTEYRCAAYSQSSEGTCQGNQRTAGPGPFLGRGQWTSLPHPIWWGSVSKPKTRAGMELSGRMLTHAHTCRGWVCTLPSARIQIQELSLNVNAKPRSNDTRELRGSGWGKWQ